MSWWDHLDSDAHLYISKCNIIDMHVYLPSSDPECLCPNMSDKVKETEGSGLTQVYELYNR